MKKVLIGGLGALLALAGCSTQTQEPDAVTIGLTYVPNIQFAPYYVAYEQGYFADLGLEVELRHHGQDEDLFGALTQGIEDVVVAGGAEMVQAHEQGVDAITFQTLYETYPVAVIVPEDSDLHTLEDLTGHTLGIPGRFGETWFGTLAFMEQADLTEQEVAIEEIGFTQQAALSGGHVDAVIGFANNDIPQFGATGLEVRAIPSDPIPVVGVGIGATSATVEDEPEVLNRIASATRQAIVDIIDDPAVAIDAASHHIPGTITPDQEQVMLQVVERTAQLYGSVDEGWGIPDLGLWEEMNTFLADMGLITEPVDLTAVVTDTITGTD